MITHGDSSCWCEHFDFGSVVSVWRGRIWWRTHCTTGAKKIFKKLKKQKIHRNTVHRLFRSTAIAPGKRNSTRSWAPKLCSKCSRCALRRSQISHKNSLETYTTYCTISWVHDSTAICVPTPTHLLCGYSSAATPFSAPPRLSTTTHLTTSTGLSIAKW